MHNYTLAKLANIRYKNMDTFNNAWFPLGLEKREIIFQSGILMRLEMSGKNIKYWRSQVNLSIRKGGDQYLAFRIVQRPEYIMVVRTDITDQQPIEVLNVDF